MMDLFSLVARLKLDDSDYQEGISSASKSSKSLGDTLKKTVKSVTIATGAALTASAAVVGKVIKDAVKAYSEYEQLVGGVETLFGTKGMNAVEYANSVGKGVNDIGMEYLRLQKTEQLVLENANAAYKTAGMSANQYMEVVTGMAAALKQSLGGDTKAAADAANQAIIDMSDNANKMGTDIESIKNAYAGFAKQNYTMLDNLKLGYGGTKSEMDRLIADAMKLDKTFKVETRTVGKGKKAHKELAYSYADVVKAIHIVQDEMGITGTTAEEAEKTIQGSLNMTKAAWQNLLVSLGGGGTDLKKAIDNLVNSGISAFRNIYPVVLTALDGIGEVIQQVAPIIADNLPQLVQDVLPKLLDAASSLLMGVIKALPGMFDMLMDSVGQLVDTLRDYLYERSPELGMVFDGIIAAWDNTIKPAFEGIINFFKDVFRGDWDAAWKDIKGAFIKIWNGLSGWFKGLFEEAKKAITEDIDWEQLGKDIWNWIVGAFNDISSWAKTTFDKAVDAMKGIDWKQVGKDIWDWIKSAFSFISTWATNTFSKAKQAILTKIDWKKLGQDVWDWIIEAFANAVSWASDLWTEVKTAIEDIDWKKLGQDLWDLITKGFMSHSIADWFVEKFTGAKDDTEKKIDWKGLGEDILNLATGPIGGIVELLFGFFEQAWNDIQDIKWAEIGDNIWSAITGAIGDIGDWIVGKIKDAVNSVIKLLNKMIGKVEGGVNKVIRGINEKLKVDVDFGKMPGWLGGGSLGGIHWSPNLKEAEFGRIKELATGGFLSEGQTAVVGERRPEMLRMVNGHALVTPIGGIQPGDRLGGGKSYTYAPVIYQQPGESSEELAERVQKVFVRWQQQEDAVWA